MVGLPRAHLYFVIVAAAAIIFSSSLETLMRVKDVDLFAEWLMAYQQVEGAVSYEQALDIYVAVNLSFYMFKIIIPFALAIHSFFAYRKLQISGLFILLWAILVLGGMAQIFIEFNFCSVFYYINLTAYLVLLGTLLAMIKLFDKAKLV